MPKKRYIAPGLIGGVFALLSGIPLSWVGGFVPKGDLPSPLKYSGTIWHGQVTGIPLTGPMAIRTSPKKLFSGTPVSVTGGGSAVYIKGDVGLSQIKDLRFQGEISDLPMTDGRLASMAGTISVTIEDLKLTKTGCRSASGTARTDVLARNRASLQWQGPELSGPISCEDGNILAALKGQDNMTEITADLTVYLGGQYRMDMMVKSRDNRAAAILPLFGFQSVDGGFRLTEQGQW